MRVLFVIPNMKIGGTRTSLLNLLKMLPYSQMTVDLLILSPYGPYMDLIYPKVNILKTPVCIKSVFSIWEDLNWFERIIKALFAAIQIIAGKRVLLSVLALTHRKVCKQNHYDVAVGFQEGDALDFATIIDANKHFCWIHNDFSVFRNNQIGLRSSFHRMNGIFFVAKTALQSFAEGMPGFEEKLSIIKNTLDMQSIIDKSIEYEVERQNTCFNIISVGRVCKQKSFDRVINASLELKKMNISLKWIVIGDGDQREALIKLAKDKEINDVVQFIGSKPNPYPYIKNSDLLVVTSIYESQPMVILEALTLGTPVVSTDFSSAKEIVLGHDYALVCDNSEQGIISGVLSAVKNIEYMKESAQMFEYDNEEIINEICRKFEEA